MTDTNANSNPEDINQAAQSEHDEAAQNSAAEAQGADASSSSHASSDDLVNEWKNKAAYFAAEMENMKKRFVREKADVIKMANEELIRAILPVFDNLDLALKSIRDNEKKAEATQSEAGKVFANLLKGVEMTLQHFQQTLERSGVQIVSSVGQPFDPSLHEAMGQSSDEKFGDNHVSSEFQKGFVLHGRVIRTAKVIVNKISKA